MKRLILVLVLLMSQIPAASAEEVAFDYAGFAQKYFNVWTDTQRPEATKEDLEAYLALLVEDVGHQHFPNDPDDTRYPDGKALMREGMTHYLGGHKTYQAKLLDVVFGEQAVAIKYHAKATYTNQNGETKSWEHTMLEVLELEGGKVSVIRKYSD